MLASLIAASNSNFYTRHESQTKMFNTSKTVNNAKNYEILSNEILREVQSHDKTDLL